MKKRLIWDILLKELETEEIIVLTGPRQVGKTTTINWLLENISSTNKLYIDLQNVVDKELFETKNFDLIINELQNKGLDTKTKMYLAIDEIQLLDTLPDAVKYLHDHYNIKFFLTGSSSFYIKHKFTESMAGRKIIYELYPLRFQEFLYFKNVSYNLSKELDLKGSFNKNTYNTLSQLYNEYVEFGGLPKIVLTEDVNRKRILLEEIFSSYVTLDVEVLADFKSSADLRKIIKLLAARIGSKLNVNELSKITGISRPTIDSYIEFLEKTYLIRNIKAFSKSVDVQTRISSKVYFVDTGIANLNADLSGGSKYENTVCHQLSFYGSLNYYSTRDGEIDFVLNNKTALEVKETPTDTDLGRLIGRSETLSLTDFRLIGKEQSARFNDYLWGGMIR